MVNPLDLDSEEDGDGMKIEGALGTIEEEAIQTGLQPRMMAITDCFQKMVAREPFLGGKVTFKFRVAKDGKTKELRIIENTLGSWETEQCIYKSLDDVVFSRPHGGEAEFTYPLSFKGRVEPTIYDESAVKDDVLKHVEELLWVKKDGGEKQLVAPAGLVLTFYLDQEGHVLSAGLAAEGAVDEEFGVSFIENLKKIQFFKTHSPYAKVTYSW